MYFGKNNNSSMRDFQEMGVMQTSEELRKNREQDLSLICTIISNQTELGCSSIPLKVILAKAKSY